MMIVQHNMLAMNANRQLKINGTNNAKTTEKLSSGYRINRASDDAAGLSISEKMRWQVRGLDKASRNAEDGASLIQVAEGALNEMHDMLQRANELATQAANDTNTSMDRQAIQKEIDQILEEIDKISEDTTFNTKPILKVNSVVKGNFGPDGTGPMSDPVSITSTDGIPLNKYGKTLDFSDVTEWNKDELIGQQFSATCSLGCKQQFVFQFTDASSSTSSASNGNGVGLDLSVEIGMNDPTLKTGEDIANKILEMVKEQESAIRAGAPADLGNNYLNETPIGHGNGIAVDGGKVTLYSLGVASGDNSGMVTATGLFYDNSNLHLQVGALEQQDILVKLRTIDSNTLNLRPIYVDSFENAGDAMQKVQNGINGISDYRAYLGAMMNRLEHTVANIDNTSENTQSAESRIRDTDMAKEMVAFSLQNILSQAGQSMLSQANQSTQGVMALLQ